MKRLFDSKPVFLFLILACFSLSGCLPKKESLKIQETPKGGEQKMVTGKKVLMVIAPKDFRDEEYQKPRIVLENAGAQITVVSKGVKIATGTLGATVNIDKDLSEVNVADYDAIIFVGGVGASIYFNDQTAFSLAQQAVQQGKVVGAICIAPSILANAGILQGKNATCFSSEAGNLQVKGANYTGQSVTIDGNIVTANGPGAAEEFGKKITELLGSN